MIKVIVITFGIIFLIRLMAPVLFRWLLQAFVKKSMRNGSFFYSNINQQRQQQTNRQNNSESTNGRSNGNVHIDYIPEKPDRKEFNGGEYVDYEEIK